MATASAIVAPAEVIAVADGEGASSWNLSGGSDPYDPSSVEGQVDAGRHRALNGGPWTLRWGEGALNCIFCDGHAKLVRLQATTRPRILWIMRADD